MSKYEYSNPKDYTPRLLVESTAKFHINAPTEAIDITDWVFHCDEQEYNDCTPVSKAHLSAAFTHTPDGEPVSINVEDIGGVLIVEHYRAVIGEKLHCRLVSISDFLIGREYTSGQVTWELIAERKDGNFHEFTNNVWIHTTPKYDAYLEAHRIPFEAARHAMFEPVNAHNAEETPFFAAAIERRALKAKK